jgi:hypothetical protein
MTKILWNNEGTPLMAFGEKAFISTTGSPKSQYKDDKTRMQLIQAEMDSIEQSLTGTANANKALFSHYASNSQGKPEEQWFIENLDNKYREGDKLITSAAANSEILFALMINPNVMGADDKQIYQASSK